MAEGTYMGVPRAKIPWHPAIDRDRCSNCEGDPQCMKFCPHGVYALKGAPPKLVVKEPNNCVVFCRSCLKMCPNDAIGFRQKSEVLAIIQKLRQGEKEVAAE